jgi:hypothetical protein
MTATIDLREACDGCVNGLVDLVVADDDPDTGTDYDAVNGCSIERVVRVDEPAGKRYTIRLYFCAGCTMLAGMA